MRHKLKHLVLLVTMAMAMCMSAVTAFADSSEGGNATAKSGTGDTWIATCSYDIYLYKPSDNKTSYQAFTTSGVVKSDMYSVLENGLTSNGIYSCDSYKVIGVHVTNTLGITYDYKPKHITTYKAVNTACTTDFGGSLSYGGSYYDVDTLNDYYSNYVNSAMSSATGRAKVLTWFKEISGVDASGTFSASDTGWWVIIAPSSEWYDKNVGSSARFIILAEALWDSSTAQKYLDYWTNADIWCSDTSGFRFIYRGLAYSSWQASRGELPGGGMLSFTDAETYGICIDTLYTSKNGASSSSVKYAPFSTTGAFSGYGTTGNASFANFKPITVSATHGSYVIYPYAGSGYAVYGAKQQTVSTRVSMAASGITYYDTVVGADGEAKTTISTGLNYRMYANSSWTDGIYYGNNIDTPISSSDDVVAMAVQVESANFNKDYNKSAVVKLYSLWRSETTARTPVTFTVADAGGLGQVLKKKVNTVDYTTADEYQSYVKSTSTYSGATDKIKTALLYGGADFTGSVYINSKPLAVSSIITTKTKNYSTYETLINYGAKTNINTGIYTPAMSDLSHQAYMAYRLREFGYKNNPGSCIVVSSLNDIADATKTKHGSTGTVVTATVVMDALGYGGDIYGTDATYNTSCTLTTDGTKVSFKTNGDGIPISVSYKGADGKSTSWVPTTDFMSMGGVAVSRVSVGSTKNTLYKLKLTYKTDGSGSPVLTDATVDSAGTATAKYTETAKFSTQSNTIKIYVPHNCNISNSKLISNIKKNGGYFDITNKTSREACVDSWWGSGKVDTISYKDFTLGYTMVDDTVSGWDVYEVEIYNNVSTSETYTIPENYINKYNSGMVVYIPAKTSVKYQFTSSLHSFKRYTTTNSFSDRLYETESGSATAFGTTWSSIANYNGSKSTPSNITYNSTTNTYTQQRAFLTRSWVATNKDTTADNQYTISLISNKNEVTCSSNTAITVKLSEATQGYSIGWGIKPQNVSGLVAGNNVTTKTGDSYTYTVNTSNGWGYTRYSLDNQSKTLSNYIATKITVGVSYKVNRYYPHDRAMGIANTTSDSVKTTSTVFNFYPEVGMVFPSRLATYNNGSACSTTYNFNVYVLGDKLRKVQQSWYTTGNKTSTELEIPSQKGTIISDTFITSKKSKTPQLYAGSDITLTVDGFTVDDALEYSANWYGLSMLNNTDGTFVGLSGADGNYSGLVFSTTADVVSQWGNSSTMKADALASLKGIVTEPSTNDFTYEVELTLDYSGSTKDKVITYEVESNSKKPVTYSTTYTTGKVYSITSTSVSEKLLTSLGDGDITTGQTRLSDWGVQSSIKNAMETGTDKDNTSANITTNSGSHWYNEMDKLFCIREYAVTQTAKLTLGDIIVEDKIPYDYAPSKGETAKGTWRFVIKDSEGNEVGSFDITDADFELVYGTNEDL